MSDHTLPAALVLTWDATTTRILCPYKCPQQVHKHVTTMPKPGEPSIVQALCPKTHEETSRSASNQYRMVFPFEIEVPGHFSWILDRDAACWKTTAWGLHDPGDPEMIEVSTSSPGKENEESAGHSELSNDVSAKPLDDLEAVDGDDQIKRLTEDLFRLNIPTDGREQTIVSSCLRDSADKGRSDLQTKNNELKLVTKLCDVKAAEAKLVAGLRDVDSFQGGNLADDVREHFGPDQTMINSQVQQMISSAPIDRKDRTVACLDRGAPLPLTLAVSGYYPNCHTHGDRALDRHVWYHRALKLASIIDYKFLTHDTDKDLGTGVYYACHIEKQLLSYFFWHHTTIFGFDDYKENHLASLRDVEPPSLSTLKLSIVIHQEHKKLAEVCRDCQEFCEKVHERTKMQLELRGMYGADTKVLHSWPPNKPTSPKRKSARRVVRPCRC